MSKEGVDEMIALLPSLKFLGNLGNFELKVNEVMKKIAIR